MNLSRPFIERPVATTLIMLAVMLLGTLAYRWLPLAALPQVDYPTIQVQTFYPGANPDLMTSAVTAPLERQLGQMPGLDQMHSSSGAGASVITLRFALGLSLEAAEQQVQAAINAASALLPQDLPSPPLYYKVNPADVPILSLALTSAELPLHRLQDLANTRVVQRLSQVPGVGLVSMGGGQRPAFRVQVDPSLLAAKGLTLEELRTVIANANVNTPKGSFDGPLRAATLDANDQVRSLSEFEQLIVSQKNGALLRLGDVAEIQEDSENTRLGAYAGGGVSAAERSAQPAILIFIQRQPGANVVATTDRVMSLLPALKSELPASVQLTPLTDRTVSVRAAIRSVQFELLLAIALVVAVIFLFLGNARATLIPGLAVPLSLVGTFALMAHLGFSLNILTLMALTIATGFVVDDAIVMIENITRHIERGVPPMKAALDGAREIGFTILSLTFSLIAVLIPLLFMGEVVGKLFYEFAVTLAVAILISAVVSLTFTPMLSARLLRPTSEATGRLHRVVTRGFERVLSAYERQLQWVLRHPSLMLGMAVGVTLLSVLLFFWVPKGFFPEQDTGVLHGVIDAREDISFASMSTLQQSVAQRLLEDPDVASVSVQLGVDGQNIRLNQARLSIALKTIGTRSAEGSLGQIIPRLQQRLAGLDDLHLWLRPAQDLSLEDRVSRSAYQMTVQDPDPHQLQDSVALIVQRLQSLPSFVDVSEDSGAQGLIAALRIDRDTASRLGVSAAAIDQALYNAFGQRMVSTIYTQSNQYRVIIEMKPSAARGLEAFDHLWVTGAGGRPVPLRSVVQVQEKLGPLVIHHQAQFPAATLTFDLAEGVGLNEALETLDEVVDELQLPISTRISYQGAALAFKGQAGHQGLLLLAAIVTMYIVLGVLYESWIQPVTILSTLPSAGIGALLALRFSGGKLDLVAMIGLILLIGIVKKNAILMIDFALDAQRHQGLSPQAAIYEACLKRFRPILMTTFAALFGALPLMLSTGTGAELRQPLGWVLVGGLLLSQLLTLFTTPVIYLAFARLSDEAQAR